MELRWERGNRPSPLVCIALVLASVILFSWRVYILVTQRFQREYQRSLARQRSISAKTPSSSEESNIKESPSEQKKNDSATTAAGESVCATDSDIVQPKKQGQEGGTSNGNIKSAQAPTESASQAVTADSMETVIQQAQKEAEKISDNHEASTKDVPPPKNRIDLLDDMVSDFSSQGDKDSLAEEEHAEQRSVVRQSSVSQSPGTRLRRASSEALLRDCAVSAARGDIDEISEGTDSESERLATAPAADLPGSSSSVEPQTTSSVITPKPQTVEEGGGVSREGSYTPKVQDFVKASSNLPRQEDEESREEGEISEDETSDEERSEGMTRSDAEAERLKLLGNEKYTAMAFDEAIDYYSKAIDACPRRSKSLAAILFCNMAAVHFSRHDWPECIQCCSDSIELDATFTKAYIRRARAYKASEKFGEAVADMKKALELDPSLTPTYQKELAALEVQANLQFEKEKEEMISKLKDFGNWALGKVGMSLDHFKVVQDPASGGYNIQYQPPEQPAQP